MHALPIRLLLIFYPPQRDGIKVESPASASKIGPAHISVGETGVQWNGLVHLHQLHTDTIFWCWFFRFHTFVYYQATHICYDLHQSVINFLANCLKVRVPKSVPLYPMPGYSGILAGEQWNVEF
jgi:hypothetical protein